MIEQIKELAFFEQLEVVGLMIMVPTLIYISYKNRSYQLKTNEFEILLNEKQTVISFLLSYVTEVIFVAIGFMEGLFVGYLTLGSVILLWSTDYVFCKIFNTTDRLICGPGKLEVKSSFPRMIHTRTIRQVVHHEKIDLLFFKGTTPFFFMRSSISKQNLLKLFYFLDREVGLYRIGVSQNIKDELS